MIVYNNEVYKYRWILLGCCTSICVLTWGIVYSIGIYYIRWIEYFEAGKAEVAVIGGINSGTGCLLGPVFSLIVHRFGFRRAGMLGGLSMVGGFIASAFATDLLLLYVFYGVFVGFGTGLSYFSASVAVNHYFIEQRSLAEGIATMGSGIGGFTFTAIGQCLLNEYDWRGTMAVLGAISAHLIVFSQITIEGTYLRTFPKLRDWKSEKSDTVLYADGDETEEKVGHRKNWFVRCLILFQNPVFLLIVTAEFFCWLCIYVPYVHLPERARLEGIDKDTCAWIASTLSLACTVGRPTVGYLRDVFQIDVFYLYGAMNFIAGVMTALSPFAGGTVGLFVYAALYGFLNVCVPLIRASVATLLGAETFTLAYGWIFLFEGIALYLGPPLAGLIYDNSKSYDYTFYATGAGLMISGLLPALKNPAIRLEKRLADRGKRIRAESDDGVLRISS